jgi:predicted TIM-barrel fold metal-dependent hydrolase
MVLHQAQFFPPPQPDLFFSMVHFMNIQRLLALAALLFFLAFSFHDKGLSLPVPGQHDITDTYEIIDVHEHVQSHKGAHMFKQAMEKQNIRSMFLVGSPEELFHSMAGGEGGFTHPELNNRELLEISKEYWDVFFAFGTFSPDDHQMLEKLKRFMEHGGTGLKLYNGHVNFYDKFDSKLDAPHLMEVYAYCEENRVPIIFHANARFYWAELKRVLDAYPNLVVNLPHYCMALINLDRIREIFDNYPNVYSDISLGHPEFAYPALEYVSDRWQAYREFIQEYKTRFLFASDMVLTDGAAVDVQYISRMISGYREFLEQEKYTNILIEEYLTSSGEVKTRDKVYFNGLQLDEDTLRHIYEINPVNFLGKN